MKSTFIIQDEQRYPMTTCAELEQGVSSTGRGAFRRSNIFNEIVALTAAR